MADEKFLIVNGDDFGASRRINRGILEAHHHGILTSASLMVNLQAAEDVVRLAGDCPDLGIGLHVNLTSEEGVPIFPLDKTANYREVIARQLTEFDRLLGCLPTHIDAHHNMHRSPTLTRLVEEITEQYGLPLREHSPVIYFSKFCGQWDGETHPDQNSVFSLIHMLEDKFTAKVTELSCHPGYQDPDFHSSYSVEREIELETLCDPRVSDKLKEIEIVFINYREIHDVTGLRPIPRSTS